MVKRLHEISKIQKRGLSGAAKRVAEKKARAREDDKSSWKKASSKKLNELYGDEIKDGPEKKFIKKHTVKVSDPSGYATANKNNTETTVKDKHMRTPDEAYESEEYERENILDEGLLSRAKYYLRKYSGKQRLDIVAKADKKYEYNNKIAANIKSWGSSVKDGKQEVSKYKNRSMKNLRRAVVASGTDKKMTQKYRRNYLSGKGQGMNKMESFVEENYDRFMEKYGPEQGKVILERTLSNLDKQGYFEDLQDLQEASSHEIFERYVDRSLEAAQNIITQLKVHQKDNERKEEDYEKPSNGNYISSSPYVDTYEIKEVAGQLEGIMDRLAGSTERILKNNGKDKS